jgi:hypothetical protein
MLINLAILKYGIENFSLDVLEYCNKDVTVKKEQHYIDLYRPDYNTLKIAGSSLGYVHTEASLAKLRSRVRSESTLEKMKNRTQTEQTRIKISEAVGISVKVTDVTKQDVTTYTSKKEAGIFLGVSDSTVGRYIKSGKLLLGKYLITEK